MPESKITAVVMPDEMLTPDEAVNWVIEAYRASVESIVETGRRLVEAKARIPHGSWGRVIERMPFSDTTALRLMQIASHPELANPAHAQDLPTAWYTLAVLAQLPADQMPDLIERKVIHADLTRSEAETIVAEFVAARQAALAAWSECCDEITAALGYFNSGQTPPADLPGTHLPPDEALTRARSLVSYLERSTTRT